MLTYTFICDLFEEMFLFQPHQVIYLDLKSLLYYNYCLKINIRNISGLTKGFVSVKIFKQVVQTEMQVHAQFACFCVYLCLQGQVAFL